MDIKRVLLQWFINSLIKTSANRARSKILATRDKFASGGVIKNEIVSNKELATELHKPIIGKFGKREVQSLFNKQV